MGVSPVDPYIIYGFWAFISLVLVAMLAMLFRNTRDIGELRGEFRGIHTRLDETNRRFDETNQRIDETNRRIEEVNTNLTNRINNLERRIENLEQSVTALRERVARETGEIRGMLQALHERLNLMMRHRHNDASGEVILTPEQVAAD